MVSSEEAYIKLVWQTGKPEHQRCSSLLLYYSILLFTPDIRLSLVWSYNIYFLPRDVANMPPG
jgi:hypothetical protein